MNLADLHEVRAVLIAAIQEKSKEYPTLISTSEIAETNGIDVEQLELLYDGPIDRLKFSTIIAIAQWCGKRVRTTLIDVDEQEVV